MPWFNCTSSMLMNVQLGGRCVKPSRVFLSCRNTDMFHTCTTMTWSHYIIHTQGEIYWKEIKTSRFGSACSTLLFFLFFTFSFLLSQLFSVWSGHQCFWEALELHQTKGNPLKGWLLLKIKQDSARPQIRDEEWKAWLSDYDGESLYIH